MNEKFLGMIGLARRAGKVNMGEEKCSKAIKAKRAKLVIIASDASDNTKKSIINSCKYYNVRYIEAYNKTELGSCMGTGDMAAMSVNDENFAKAILDRLNENP